MHGRKTDFMAANIDYMMDMVKIFLSGKTPRYIFELNFQTEILARYKKMARENREYAELFYDLISEGGVDAGDGLSDTEFKRLIQKQYNEVKSIAADGFFNHQSAAVFDAYGVPSDISWNDYAEYAGLLAKLTGWL
jgi:hypothetical protein